MSCHRAAHVHHFLQLWQCPGLSVLPCLDLSLYILQRQIHWQPVRGSEQWRTRAFCAGVCTNSVPCLLQASTFVAKLLSSVSRFFSCISHNFINLSPCVECWTSPEKFCFYTQAEPGQHDQSPGTYCFSQAKKFFLPWFFSLLQDTITKLSSCVWPWIKSMQTGTTERCEWSLPTLMSQHTVGMGIRLRGTNIFWMHWNPLVHHLGNLWFCQIKHSEC